MSLANRAIHVLARAVIQSEGHILLCKTPHIIPNFYYLPGGHVEIGETTEACCIRELREESSFDIKIIRFLGILEYIFEPFYTMCHNHEYNIVFECHSPQLHIKSIIPRMEEHVELEWVPMEKLEEIDLNPSPFKKLLPLWLKGQAQELHSSVSL